MMANNNYVLTVYIMPTLVISVQLVAVIVPIEAANELNSKTIISQKVSTLNHQV